MNGCDSAMWIQCDTFGAGLLRKEGRSSGLAVQPLVIRLMSVSLLGMSAARLSWLVSGRFPRSTPNMICMGLVTSERTETQPHVQLTARGVTHVVAMTARGIMTHLRMESAWTGPPT